MAAAADRHGDSVTGQAWRQQRIDMVTASLDRHGGSSTAGEGPSLIWSVFASLTLHFFCSVKSLKSLSFLQVIALADAVEENQDRLLQSFAGLKSATHLLILLIRLWQKLSSDQTAILEAAFLPLQEDTQELGWEETVDAAVAHLLKTCLSKSSKEQALNLSSQLNIPKDTSRLKRHITLLCDRLAKGGRLCVSSDAAAPQAMVMPGGCTPIPESDLEERSLDSSAELFTNHKHLITEPPVPEVSALQGVLE
nr:protein PTHB1-like [Meriones unguiculatus]